MKLRVYAVYDSKAEAFLQPFFCRARGEATRMFTDACCDEKHQFFKHAADYTLFEIGEFEQDDGSLIPLVPTVSLGNALVYRSQTQGPELVREVQHG